MAGSIPGAREPLFLDLLGRSVYAFLDMLGPGWGHFVVGLGRFWDGFGIVWGGIGVLWGVGVRQQQLVDKNSYWPRTVTGQDQLLDKNSY